MVTKFTKYDSISEKNYFDTYDSIAIFLKTEYEFYRFQEAVNQIDDIDNSIDTGFEMSICEYLEDGEEPYIRFRYGDNRFSYGKKRYLEGDGIGQFVTKRHYYIEDLEEVIRIIKARGKIYPSYEPKRFITESVNEKNIYKDHKSIIIVIKDMDEFNKCKNDINEKLSYLYNNITDGFDSGIRNNLSNNDTPYLRYSHLYRGFTYGTLEMIRSRGRGDDFDEMFYIEDLDKFIELVRNDGEYNDTPSYKPRTFIKESVEYFDNYSHVVIEMKTLEELELIYDYVLDHINPLLLRDIDSMYFRASRDVINSGEVANFIYYPDEKRMKYGKKSYTIDDPYDEFKIEKFYTVNELENFKRVIEGKPPIPSYKPRTFIKENKEYFKKYPHIVISFDDKDDVEKVFYFIKDNNLGYISDRCLTGTKEYIEKDKPPMFIYNSDSNSWMYGSIDYVTRHSDLHPHLKIYKSDNLIEIKKLISQKDLDPPSYKPKTFITESKSYFENYSHILIILKSNEEIETTWNFINDNKLGGKRISNNCFVGAKDYLAEEGESVFIYDYKRDCWMFGTVSSAINYPQIYKISNPYYFDDLNKIKKLILRKDLELPSYEPKRFITESKSYFKKYSNILIHMKSIEEIKTTWNYINDNKMGNLINDRCLNGAIEYLTKGEQAIFLYSSKENQWLYGTLDSVLDHPGSYPILKTYYFDDLYEIKNLIINRHREMPSYKPKTFISEDINILLERSSLTKFGVPREVMQPIQKDLALSSDAEWEKMDHKKDIIDYLRKGDKNLFVQIGLDNIKVIGSFPSMKGTQYFIDNYVYKDTDWTGEFKKLKREFNTLTQTALEILPKTNIYRLVGDYSIRKQNQRKMIRKEKSFIDFSDNFKTNFLQKFDKILKRISGTNFDKAKNKISDNAKKIATENNLLIKSLDNPLTGHNSLSILDEFLYQFEDSYSEYFEERIDIQELSKYFTIDKVMTMFMYYIYTGKILN